MLAYPRSPLLWQVGSSAPKLEADTTKMPPLIARFMGPTWGPSGADTTQGPHVGPMNRNFDVFFVLRLNELLSKQS